MLPFLVSVVIQGTMTLAWSPSPSLDVAFYRVYERHVRRPVFVSWAYPTDVFSPDTQPYVDREYRILYVPQFLAGGVLLKTANDDKEDCTKSWSLVVSDSCVVAVAVDAEADSAPDWLASWAMVDSDRISTDDTIYRVYVDTVGVGGIVLGPNCGDRSSSMWVGAVVPMSASWTMVSDSVQDTTAQVEARRGFSLWAVTAVDTAGNESVLSVPVFAHVVQDSVALGDVNGDGRVDFRDMTAVGLAFGSTWQGSRYNFEADLNTDGRVDFRDMTAVGRVFGRVRQ